MQPGNSTRAVTTAVLYLVLAAAGIFGLPAAFSSGSRWPGVTPGIPVAALSTIAWVVLAGVLAFLGWILAPSLSQGIRSVVRGAPWFNLEGPRAIPRFTEVLVSVPVVVALNIALSEAILRAPLTAVLGGAILAATSDAWIAGLCVFMILVLLIRLHQVARPWVQSGAWYGLDALVPTASSEGARRFYDTGGHRTRVIITQRAASSGLAATISAASDSESETILDSASAKVGQPTATTVLDTRPPGDASSATIIAEAGREQPNPDPGKTRVG